MSDSAQPAHARVPYWPLVLALVAAVLGLVFASSSTIDYVAHLDRQVHNLHCSIIPGAAADAAQESGCRTALYSPYSAVLKDRIWGGVPISLLAVGAFSFFVAFSLYLLVGIKRVPRRAFRFLAATSITPLLASIVMGVISAVKLGTFCQTCIGIYASSVLLAVASLIAWRKAESAEPGLPTYRGSGVAPTLVDDADGLALAPRALGAGWLPSGWLVGLGLFALGPSLYYLETVPSYRSEVTGCGELVTEDDPKNALLHIKGGQQPATLVVDPLCPTCSAFHQRLVAEGVFAKLDTTLVLFPLDSECNWNLTAPLHPGACVVARAVICGEEQGIEVLEWAYEEQERLTAMGKSKDGVEKVTEAVVSRWGKLAKCIESKEARLQLDEHLRFAVKNKLPLSTPQLFLSGKKLCDEDLDIGLSYALKQLAPEVSQ